MPEQEDKGQSVFTLRSKIFAAAVTLLLSFARDAACTNHADTVSIAKVMHTCGERRYFAKDDSLTVNDRAAVRDIVSYLYSGVRVLIELPNPTPPVLNERTRRSIADSAFLKSSFEGEHIDHPTPEQISKRVDILYLTDPVTWNIHEGPSVEHLRRILKDPAFAKRLGTKGVMLLEQRLSGKTGQRAQILLVLKDQFGVQEVVKFWSDENCHIGDGFGAD